ncbi:hypothetical protein P8C59_009517 [Phyllachora maydis]|uniref:Phosphoribosylaminoimidazole-succinocarboxamide synthase n=1 Tax=Phyllachora maydis TaxID=1825666 RepID=A0AAD9IDG1_9PEZI|nr:hypothetical protein P8C59_009517 [Phyllachora maydis]
MAAAVPVHCEVPITSLPKLAAGKVRDLYALDDKTVLFVTTDRISAYDVVLRNGVPHKGRILTQLSAHWFRFLAETVPGLQTHFLSLDLPPSPGSPAVTAAEAARLRGRSMVVRRLRPLPLEAIVRGFLAGSAWAEYAAAGTVHGLPQPPGLRQCEAFPSGPLYTPSTKAPPGGRDENIAPAQAAALPGVGARTAARVEALALRVYGAAAAYARARGVIIADTKFEFAVDEETDEVVLVDEVLTPDSSRFWPADAYEVGRDQVSFDKQYLRDWLVQAGLKGKEGVEMPDEVARLTSQRYLDVFARLTGRTVGEVTRELDSQTVEL